MVKARVVCMQHDAKKIVESLYEFGWIHVSRSKLGEPDVPFSSFQEISEKLISLRAMEKSLNLEEKPVVEKLEELGKLFKQAAKLQQEFCVLEQTKARIGESSSRISQTSQTLSLLEPLEKMGVSKKVFSATTLLDFCYFHVSDRNQFERAAKTVGCKLAFSGNYCIAAVEKSKAAALLAKVSEFSKQIALPEIASNDFASESQSLLKEKSALQQELLSLGKEGGELEKKISVSVSATRAQFEEHAKLSSLPNKFGKTAQLEIIEGWVPARHFLQLEHALSKAVAGSVVVEKAKTGEDAPTLLSNPPLIRRFEFLVRFFSLPSAHEYDPTLFIAITFPIIFGMILGDIGYGVLAMLLAAFLYRTAKKSFIKHLSGMMFLSGISTTIWGVVFGEFFGGEEMLGIELHPIIHRGGEGITLLIVAALIVGLMHLALGLLIGVYTNLMQRHYSHAAAKACWLLVEAGFLLLGMSLFVPNIFGSFTISAAVIAAGVIGLFKFEGVAAVTEVPSLLSNILSYLRIMALGLSGVILSQVVNTIPVESSFESLLHAAGTGDAIGILLNALPFLFFALLLVLGHGVALGLGLFESGIQSLRLHYVEFFSKFYHGGGQAFLSLRDKSKF